MSKEKGGMMAKRWSGKRCGDVRKRKRKRKREK